MNTVKTHVHYTVHLIGTVNHGICFLGHDWLVLVDGYSKYPCMNRTGSTSTKATTEFVKQDFADFWYHPHTLVTDNATMFTSQEFQAWCKAQGILHLIGAPYHPATNGVAKRQVQTFQKSLRNLRLPPIEALQEFLKQYLRTATSRQPTGGNIGSV